MVRIPVFCPHCWFSTPSPFLLGLQRPGRKSLTLVLHDKREVVLDVSVGKRYKYALLQENLIVRGKNYAEHT